MNRRSFLALLSSATAAAIGGGLYMPEALLWTPAAPEVAALPVMDPPALFSLDLMVRDILDLMRPRCGHLARVPGSRLGDDGLSDQFSVQAALDPFAFHRPKAWNTRMELYDGFCRPVASCFADKLEHRGITLVGELAPYTGPEESVTVRDSLSGLAIRGVRTWDPATFQHLVSFDMIGGRA